MFKFYFIILVYLSSQVSHSQLLHRPGKNPFTTKRNSSVNGFSETGLLTNEIYIPSSGLTSLLISLGLPTGTIDSTSSGGSVETKSGTETTFELNHGLTDKFSIYASFTNLDRRSAFSTVPETSANSNGLGDNIIGVKGIFDKTTNWVYYDLSFVFANKKPINTETTTGSVSPGSIRPAYNLKFGFGLPSDLFTFGINYTFNLYQAGESSTSTAGVLTTSTSHNSGAGFAWQVFIQSNTTWRYGLSYKETRADSYERTTAGVASTNNASTIILPAIYLLTPMGPAADFIFTIYKPMTKNSSAQQNFYLGTAQLRLLF